MDIPGWLKVGARVVLARDVEIHPHETVRFKAGETGTVVSVPDPRFAPLVHVRLDTHHEGLDEWKNVLQWNDEDELAEFWADVRPLDACGECGGSGKLTRLGGDWGKTPDTEVECWACEGSGAKGGPAT